jgi:hypothetical protein
MSLHQMIKLIENIALSVKKIYAC